jgi:hypothetical protein
VAAAAEKRQQPARIGIVAAADVHPEPDSILEAGARPFRPRRLLAGGSRIHHLLRRGHARAVDAHQSGRDLLRRLLLEQALGKLAIFFLYLHRLQQGREQTLMIVSTDILRRRRLDPFGLDPGTAKHRFHSLAARIGNDEHRRPLLAGAAGTARAMLKRLGVARQFDMDDE